MSLCWLPVLGGRPYRSRFIATSSACAAAGLSVLLTSCLTAIKSHVIECCAAVYERNGKKLFWSVRGLGGFLGGLKSRDFLESGLSACGFSALLAALPRGLVGERLMGLVERTFNREGSLFWLVVVGVPFLLLGGLNDINYGHVWECVVLSVVFWTICL